MSQKTKENSTNVPKKTKSTKVLKSSVKQIHPNKSKIATARRRNKIYKLTLMGFKVYEIAKEISISERAVEKHLQSLRKEHSKEIQVDKNQLIKDLMSNMDMRRKRLWKEVVNAETSRDRTYATTQLREEDRDLVKVMEKVGVLPRDIDTQVNIQQNKLSNVTIQIVKPEDIEDD